MSANFQEEYKRKHISIEEAVSKIKSNDDIVVAQCASEPQGCMSKFHLVKDKVQNVKVFSVLIMKPYDFYMKPEMKEHFELCSWFYAPSSRVAIRDNAGTVTYLPNMLHRAALDRLCVKKTNIFFGTCTPMDSKGFVSLISSFALFPWDRGSSMTGWITTWPWNFSGVSGLMILP